MSESFSGEVIWFNPKRGFGFIGWNKLGTDQEDLFVHFSDINCEGFKSLHKGQKVKFDIGSNKHGDPKAIKVTVVV